MLKTSLSSCVVANHVYKIIVCNFMLVIFSVVWLEFDQTQFAFLEIAHASLLFITVYNCNY